jgi:hypothetical protein
MRLNWVVCSVLGLVALQASAEVVRVDVRSRGDVLEGRSWGLAGGYEKLAGQIHFEVDPQAAANQVIRDIGFAVKNAAGKVEFSAEFLLIRPKDMSLGNGTVLFDTSNRGSKRILTFFNHASSPGDTWDAWDPTTEQNFGDGFLMRHGFSLLWVGWQFDVPDRPRLMRSYLPKTQGIEGLVRSDFVVRERVFDRTLADRNHIPYPVSDANASENVLTVRDSVEGERRVIPRNQWQFARLEGERVVPDNSRIYLESGFEPHKIYEVIYKAENPEVVGLGLAAIRDSISHVKYDGSETLGIPAGSIQHAIGFGLSQPGRVLRTFLYDGFNADVEQRKVFDGVMAHIAGSARGSFNIRFGQPSRDAHPYLNFFYPTDIFPFTDVEQTDPVTGQKGGVLTRVPEQFMPKVFNSWSSYEYWGRAASLMHTTVDGQRDAPMMETARVYHFAGAQHLPDPFPPPVENGQQPNNPNDFSWMMRALLLAMNRWVTDDIPAPPSRVPTLADGTLVAPEQVRFPNLSWIKFPTIVHKAYRVDYGPEFASKGIISKEPPEMIGPPYPILVPQVDADGNELAALLMPEVAVPLATYTGWNLYNEAYGPTHIISHMSGSFIPFAATEAERERRGDPRPSIEERYPTKQAYLGQVAEYALGLIGEGYLLDEDLPEILQAAGAHWDYLTRARG